MRIYLRHCSSHDFARAGSIHGGALPAGPERVAAEALRGGEGQGVPERSLTNLRRFMMSMFHNPGGFNRIHGLYNVAEGGQKTTTFLVMFWGRKEPSEKKVKKTLDELLQM